MPLPLEDATGLMIHAPLSLLNEPENEDRERERVLLKPSREENTSFLLMLFMLIAKHSLSADWTEGCPLTAEFLVLGRKHKGLGYDVEVLKAMGLLHPLDVFVEPVFPCELVRPGKQREH